METSLRKYKLFNNTTGGGGFRKAGGKEKKKGVKGKECARMGENKGEVTTEIVEKPNPHYMRS